MFYSSCAYVPYGSLDVFTLKGGNPSTSHAGMCAVCVSVRSPGTGGVTVVSHFVGAGRRTPDYLQEQQVLSTEEPPRQRHVYLSLLAKGVFHGWASAHELP